MAPVSVGNDEDASGRLHGNRSVHRLFQSALEFAQRSGWKYVELRGGISQLGDIPASESYFGHRLTLLPAETVLFAGVDSSVRRAVRKAETSGLRIEFAHDFDAIRAFHRLLCKTRQRHGLPPQPLRFFAHIQRHIMTKGHGCVVLAKLAGEPVAGATFFHFGKTVIYKFGASDESFQELRGNNLVMWEAIKHYAGQGFETMDFGRTSLGNEGLRRFKLSWGTKERQIDYARFDCRSSRFVTAVDRSSGWHNRIFRILPPILSRAIGAALYRHIA